MDIEMSDGVERLHTKLAQLQEASSYIHRVRKRQRRANDAIFDPQMVAIGPYHHGKEDLQAMEITTKQYVKNIISWKPEKSLQDYWSAIAPLEKTARDCYSQSVSMNTEDFIEMLLVDSLFIIELVRPDSTTGQTCGMDGVLYDLMLLDNQVPFFILRKVFEVIRGNPRDSFTLISYILTFCSRSFPGKKYYNSAMMRNPNKVQHILDIVHGNWYSFASEAFAIDIPAPETKCNRTIPTASELQLSKPKMNCLIKTKDDSKILTSCGIILNQLGTDQEVAEFANRLCYKVACFDDNKFLYGEFFDRVNAHHENANTVVSWHVHLAELRRTHFRSPWSVVSLVAAVMLLMVTIFAAVMAGIQTFRK